MSPRPVTTIAGAVFLAAWLASAPSDADTFDAGTTSLSLIQAMERAEARPGRDVIELSRNHTYKLRSQYDNSVALPTVTDDLLIKGHRAKLKWQGEGASGFLHVAEGGRLELRFLALTGATNSAITVDGKLVLRGTRLVNNTAYGADGGAIRVSESGTARLHRSVLDGNATSSRGLGFRCRDEEFPGNGGGIYNAGRLRAIGTTFVDNAARYGVNVPPSAKQAPKAPAKIIPTCSGIGGHVYNTGRSVLRNAQFLGEVGSAIVSMDGRIRMINATVQGGQLNNHDGSRFTIVNSVVLDGACTGLDSRGHNVISGLCRELDHPTDRWVPGVHPLLSADARSVAGLEILEPVEGSPLLDAGDPSRCPPRDIAGRIRPFDGNHDGLDRCDIGAAEARPGRYPVDGRVVGLWYEPERDGHFLLVEQPAPGRITAFWATYDGDGNPLWLFGNGGVDGDKVELELTRQQGMRFGVFDRSQLTFGPWGSMDISFSSCRKAAMTWNVRGDSALDGKATLTRLTQVDGEECLP